MRISHLLFLVLLPLIWLSCQSSKNIVGKYRSFAYGKNALFYNVEFDFRPDSTFDFRMFFDLMGDYARGRYQLQGRYLRLHYEQDDADNGITNTLSSRNLNARIFCLFRKNNKLFPCDSVGNVKNVNHGKSRYYFKKGTFFWHL